MKNNSTNTPEKMLPPGKRVQKYRKAAGLTQPELIEMIEALPENNGKTRNDKHISAIERGERELSIEYAMLISKVLHVRHEYLLGYDDFPTKDDKVEAYRQKQWEKHIENPLALIKNINSIWDILGFKEIENELTKTEINEMRILYTDAASKEELTETFEYKIEHPDIWHTHRVGIKAPDGRIIYLSEQKVMSITQDIIDYAKFKLSKEFENPVNYIYKQDMKKVFDTD